jgi:hypothetical protein
MSAAAKKSSKAALAPASEHEDMIIDYLQKTNRPYSAVDIFNNLKERIPKTAVVKLCTQLVESSECIILQKITFNSGRKKKKFMANSTESNGFLSRDRMICLPHRRPSSMTWILKWRLSRLSCKGSKKRYLFGKFYIRKSLKHIYRTNNPK